MRRNSISSEFARILTVLSVPAAIAAVFPYEAVNFRFIPEAKAERPIVAFVQLDAATEHSAIKTAKSSLRGGEARAQLIRADLSFGELPEEPVKPVLPVPPARPAVAPAPLVFGTPVYQPTSAAVSPRTIPAAAPAKAEPTFSRQELLKID